MKNYYINNIAPMAHEIFSRLVFVFAVISTTSTLAAGLEIIWNKVFPFIAEYREINLWQAALIIAALFAYLQIGKSLIHLRINKSQR